MNFGSNSIKQFCFLILLFAFIFTDLVAGHSFLVFPPPRVNHQGATFGQKNSDPRLDRFWPHILDQGPSCRIGSNNYPSQGRPQRTFKAGEIIPVTFNIRIPHPSPPGFVIAVWYNNNDNFQNNILMADFNPPEKDAYWGAGQYTFQIKLPNKPCQSCVFLWAWGSLKDQGFYLDCADIQILPERAPAVLPTLLPERTQSCFTLSKKTCENTPGCRALWGLAVLTTNQMVYLGCGSTQNCANRQKRRGRGGGRPANVRTSVSVGRPVVRVGQPAPPRQFPPNPRPAPQPVPNPRPVPPPAPPRPPVSQPGNDFQRFGLQVNPQASGCPDRGCGQAPPQFNTRGPGMCIEPINVPNNIHFIVETCVTLEGYQPARCPPGVGI
eukprot:TRINITY_DN4592_c0_g3_i1.p1 TRINITY_DN4592_c0_g3~~TRINITY_DN4592_c0_g3_i1.p1  ORF type:complete len:381 (-),score=84.28 TRINITY_DN4592_c0_g3_i1:102-1244(-)